MRPKNKFLNLSALKTINGEYACDYFCCSADFRRCIVGVSALPSSAKAVFDRGWYNCRNISSIEFPNLETIQAERAFQYGFESCNKLSTMSFPKLKSIGSGTTNYTTVFGSAW